MSDTLKHGGPTQVVLGKSSLGDVDENSPMFLRAMAFGEHMELCTVCEGDNLCPEGNKLVPRHEEEEA